MPELWRDLDRVRGNGLHMNWMSCSCSSCASTRVVAEFRRLQEENESLRRILKNETGKDWVTTTRTIYDV